MKQAGDAESDDSGCVGPGRKGWQGGKKGKQSKEEGLGEWGEGRGVGVP